LGNHEGLQVVRSLKAFLWFSLDMASKKPLVVAKRAFLQRRIQWMATLIAARDGDRFLLYSIGWNEKDDGGTPAVPGEDIQSGDWAWLYPR
jgi:hypothetical protein